MYRRYGKRALDLALTIPALIPLAPPLPLIARVCNPLERVYGCISPRI